MKFELCEIDIHCIDVTGDEPVGDIIRAVSIYCRERDWDVLVYGQWIPVLSSTKLAVRARVLAREDLLRSEAEGRVAKLNLAIGDMRQFVRHSILCQEGIRIGGIQIS